ncbi:hypothetical protein RHECNPAF_6420074 [Rhizobium etli CNPAF512]|nr:hypothetical protein RHECNPAF_6420074 [Rhizobium etli CNPAF512]
MRRPFLVWWKLYHPTKYQVRKTSATDSSPIAQLFSSADIFGDHQMAGRRLSLLHAHVDIGYLDKLETGGGQPLPHIAVGVGEALVRSDHEGAAGENFCRQGFGGEDEQAARRQVLGGPEEQRLERAEIGQHIGGGDDVEGFLVIVLEEILDLGDEKRLIKILLMGNLDHLLRYVDAGHIFTEVAQGAAGQTRAAAEIEQPLERSELQLLQALAHQHRHVIAKLLDENILEHLGMLIEQGLDIGVGRLGRRFTAAHRGDAHGGSAVVIRIDRQNFLIGRHGRVDITGLFQRQRAVIGLGKGFFVDFLRHRGPYPLVSGKRLRPLSMFCNGGRAGAE